MKLFLVDLEPIEKRYTKQWQTWIPKLVKDFKPGLDVQTISGKSDGEIKSGQFLDINRTQTDKSEQIIEIANVIIIRELNPELIMDVILILLRLCVSSYFLFFFKKFSFIE